MAHHRMVGPGLASVLVPVVATAIIVGMVAVAGGRLGSLVAPFPDAADGAAVTCVDEAVKPVGRASTTGRARLCVSLTGTQTTVDLEQLPAEVAYTAWLAYFDQPSRCRTSPCGDGDPARGDEGLVERIDAALPDPAGRVSMTRTFHEIQLRPGSEVQVMIFQRGVLGRVLPPERVRLLVEWPLAPASPAYAAGEDRHADEPLIGRAIFWMRRGFETSDDGH